jgi:glutamate dehydrogenase/leucine dehydrogenase
VYTGLDNIMTVALEETVQTAEKNNVSFRIAAYMNAINKVGRYYDSLGLTI